MKLSDLVAPIRWIRFALNAVQNGGALQNLRLYQISTKEFVCQMQGRMALFMVNGAERHKQLRLALDAYERSAGSAQSARDLNEAKKALDTFVTHQLAKACDEIFGGLHSYFRPRYRPNQHRPRFCIKLRQQDRIYTFARDGSQVERQEISFEAARSGNTGFEFVSLEGKPFYENDIPGRCKDATYKNPRLDAGKASRYSSPAWLSLKRVFKGSPIQDVNWIDCWVVSPNLPRPNASSCYKSTLIVPMTLLRSQVDEEFIESLTERNHRLPDDSAKYNFGFLCGDCHESDFFQEEDSQCLFVYADFFSLFLISAYAYREHSQTYAAAEEALSSSSRASSTRKTRQRRPR